MLNITNVNNKLLLKKFNFFNFNKLRQLSSSTSSSSNSKDNGFGSSTSTSKSNIGKLYYWNNILFSSTFNEIVRLDPNIDLTQYSLFREKNFIKSFDKGFFTLMPFVVRSLERLIKLIDNEMFKFGAQKLIMPSLVGKHLWIKSGRWEDSGQDLFRLFDRHQNEYCLAPTHEEVITQILASCNQLSHRQIPIYLYQITPKYRDELRTKYGLLRAREFLMKDLYTFDKDEESSIKTYEKICSIYENLFNLLELPIMKTVGSVGKIGGKHSHEYLLETSLGEDEVYTCLDCSESFNSELLSESNIKSPYCLNCKSHNLSIKKSALELGHSFLLSDRYSSRMGAFYTTENSNKQLPLQMGCYGLGVSRILAASVEYLSRKSHQPQLSSSSSSSSSIIEEQIDEPSTITKTKSSNYHYSASTSIFLRWPRLLVPFKLCLILPKRDSKEDHGKGTEFSLHLAKILTEKFGEDLLIDDRSNLTIGKRLLTAKTIGIPFIIVAGRNIIDQRPKFELFDMYSSDDSSSHSNEYQDPRSIEAKLMTQAQLLNFLDKNLKKFSI